MSNLGCVWYIDTKRGIREKYPVVYDNAQYWVCKIPGSFNVKEIRKDYCVDSQYWETVKEAMNRGVQFCGDVYVKCGEKLDNKKVSRQEKRELEKSRLRSIIYESEQKIEKAKIKKSKYLWEIKQLDEVVERNSKIIEESEEKLSKLV